MKMKVSVIVPIYNSEAYLKDCLDSLVNQTLEEIEIIAIDDASTDQSFNILQQYQRKYPNKLKIFQHETNLGQSKTRNDGLKLATGEYIGFVDSDDYVHYQMFESMYNGAVNHHFPDVISTSLLFVKDNYYLDKNFEMITRRSGNSFDVLEQPDLVLDESPSVCTKLFRRDTLKNISFLDDKMWEDVAFSFSLLFNANRVLVFPNADYFYRKRIDSGVSSKGFQPNPKLMDIFAVADEIKIQTQNTGRYELLKEQINFIQLTTCLQRVAEVLSWDIPEERKNSLVTNLLKLITFKYGDYRRLNQDLLSSRVGFLELETFNSYMQNLHTKEIITPDITISIDPTIKKN